MVWTPADLRTIGFFANQPLPLPDWLANADLEFLCSASSCIAKWPEGWVDRWLHNELWLYDRLATLESVIPAPSREAFLRYGVRALPVQFTEQGEGPLDLTVVHAEPIPASFVRLGYDVCGWHCEKVDCSPLSCNAMAGACGANRFCLFDSFAAALAATAGFWREQCEPGPYVLLEIWAEHLPG